MGKGLGFALFLCCEFFKFDVEMPLAKRSRRREWSLEELVLLEAYAENISEHKLETEPS